MLKEVKIDFELMSSLGNGICNFEGVVKSMVLIVEVMSFIKKYSEEMVLVVV